MFPRLISMPAAPLPMPRARRQNKSGVVIPNAPKWYQRLAAWLIWLAIKLVSATIRFRLDDPEGFSKRAEIRQAIFTTWHNRLVLCVEVYRRAAQVRTGAPGLVGLVSASKDGAFLAAIFERFGVQAARGSSSRRGAQALVELKTWAERGYDLALTPDGPRGPRYVLADGAVVLAQFTGLPLVPVSFNLNWKICVKSWDRFQIPLPFARCDMRFGKVFYIPRELTAAGREKFRQEVEAEMRAIVRD